MVWRPRDCSRCGCIPRVNLQVIPLRSSLQLTGRSGELVQELYAAAGKDSKKFEALTKQFEVRLSVGVLLRSAALSMETPS